MFDKTHSKDIILNMSFTSGVVGIIGGSGPLASAHLYRRIMQEAARKGAAEDGDYPQILLDSRHIGLDAKGNYDSKTSDILAQRARALIELGASKIVIACNTLHLAVPERSQIPIVALPEKTIEHVQTKGLRQVGILSSRYAKESQLFSKGLKLSGIEPVETTEPEQQELDLIIKSIMNNQRPTKELVKIVEELRSRGAETVILGCTELSILNKKLRNVEDPIEIVIQDLLGEK